MYQEILEWTWTCPNKCRRGLKQEATSDDLPKPVISMEVILGSQDEIV